MENAKSLLSNEWYKALHVVDDSAHVELLRELAQSLHAERRVLGSEELHALGLALSRVGDLEAPQHKLNAMLAHMHIAFCALPGTSIDAYWRGFAELALTSSDLLSADAGALETLLLLVPTLAQRIIENGAYKKVNDVLTPTLDLAIALSARAPLAESHALVAAVCDAVLIGPSPNLRERLYLANLAWPKLVTLLLGDADRGSARLSVRSLLDAHPLSLLALLREVLGQLVPPTPAPSEQARATLQRIVGHAFGWLARLLSSYLSADVVESELPVLADVLASALVLREPSVEAQLSGVLHVLLCCCDALRLVEAFLVPSMSSPPLALFVLERHCHELSVSALPVLCAGVLDAPALPVRRVSLALCAALASLTARGDSSSLDSLLATLLARVWHVAPAPRHRALHALAFASSSSSSSSLRLGLSSLLERLCARLCVPSVPLDSWPLRCLRGLSHRLVPLFDSDQQSALYSSLDALASSSSLECSARLLFVLPCRVTCAPRFYAMAVRALEVALTRLRDSAALRSSSSSLTELGPALSAIASALSAAASHARSSASKRWDADVSASLRARVLESLVQTLTAHCNPELFQSPVPPPLRRSCYALLRALAALSDDLGDEAASTWLCWWIGLLKSVSSPRAPFHCLAASALSLPLPRVSEERVAKVTSAGLVPILRQLASSTHWPVVALSFSALLSVSERSRLQPLELSDALHARLLDYTRRTAPFGGGAQGDLASARESTWRHVHALRAPSFAACVAELADLSARTKSLLRDNGALPARARAAVARAEVSLREAREALGSLDSSIV